MRTRNASVRHTPVPSAPATTIQTTKDHFTGPPLLLLPRSVVSFEEASLPSASGLPGLLPAARAPRIEPSACARRYCCRATSRLVKDACRAVRGRTPSTQTFLCPSRSPSRQSCGMTERDVAVVLVQEGDEPAPVCLRQVE
jgi:hypothetical protein